ncbi:ATP-binding protein [Chitinimonas koreensis]|uniref:ATP-binding protein n=1 Tax=Chitinimonas koreensis TaxID=356302 RepID=UPI00040B03B9|nr:ATP-binding protein [Chitinimonas koreensis]QNM98378.1 PAS domain-containing protein [Chitinimonas koreensis]
MEHHDSEHEQHVKASLFANLVDTIEVGIFAVDRSMKVALWNRYMAVHSGRREEDVCGRNLFELFPELPRAWLERKIESVFILKNYAFTSWEQRPFLFRFPHNRPVTGGVGEMRQNTAFIPLKNEGGEVDYVYATVFDYTDTAIFQQRLKDTIAELEQKKAEQQQLIHKLEEAHNQLLQSEKLAAIGQLAAGVAHEINNPIGFVHSNFGSLERYVNDLFRLIDGYCGAEGSLPAPLAQQIEAIKQQIDYHFLKDDIPALIAESVEGLSRVRRIVQDLRDFSRIDTTDWQFADLHQCLDSTLNVVNNEIRYKAEVVKQYGQLPQVECRASQLNQVFLNLLVNAAQAIPAKGTITVRTGCDETHAWVEIADDGSGIPAANLKRIFEPFFTTKPVGKGTGLGLSVTYSIIQKHHGRIDVSSEEGRGTTFRIWLPIRQAAEDETAAAA